MTAPVQDDPNGVAKFGEFRTENNAEQQPGPRGGGGDISYHEQMEMDALGLAD